MYRWLITHDGAQVTCFFVHRLLPIGARAAAHDLEGVLHLAATTQLIHYIVNEPLQHLSKQLPSRKFLALAKTGYSQADT